MPESRLKLTRKGYDVYEPSLQVGDILTLGNSRTRWRVERTQEGLGLVLRPIGWRGEKRRDSERC